MSPLNAIECSKAIKSEISSPSCRSYSPALSPGSESNVNLHTASGQPRSGSPIFRPRSSSPSFDGSVHSRCSTANSVANSNDRRSGSSPCRSPSPSPSTGSASTKDGNNTTQGPNPYADTLKPKCNCEELERVECHLENKDLWDKFHELGTEMIITKTGR